MAKVPFPHKPAVPLAIIVDLAAVAHNYRTVKSRLKTGTTCAAVLKANAYGMGVRDVALRLYQEGCRHFFVAHLSEGIELKSIINEDAFVYVLNGLRTGDEDYYDHFDLIPVLGDPFQIRVWNSYCERKQKCLKAVLHFDTGMTRTGLSSRAVQNLGFLQVSNMEIVCVMSHLVCAYQPAHPMNEAQRATFDTLRARFPFAKASLANSGGSTLGKQYHFDMVRPGLALTGCHTVAINGDYKLKPAIKAYAQIMQINEIAAGDSIGYDATFVTSRASRIATLGVGYADGYLRNLSNKGEVYFDGQKLPVVGRISMDLLTIDITDVESDKIQIGDWVELFGDNILIHEVAEKAGTVSWELLTLLGTRFERFYINSLEAQEAA
jgi:alanine racemase